MSEAMDLQTFIMLNLLELGTFAFKCGCVAVAVYWTWSRLAKEK